MSEQVLWDPPAMLRANRWWRVDWWRDVRYVAWHLTFETAPELHRLVADYQRALARSGGFDLIPRDWLHLTLHGVGVAASLAADTVARVEVSVRERLAAVPAGLVEFSSVAVHPEALGLCPSPASTVHAVRAAIREGLVDVLGASALEEVDGYVPHVSIGYVNTPQPAAPVLAALDAVRAEPALVRIRDVSLLEMYLDQQVHRWRVLARVRLSAGTDIQ